MIFLLDRAARNAVLRQEREKEIVMRLNKANALRLSEQYDGALAETDKALAVFADHNVALAMKQLLVATRRRASGNAGPHLEPPHAFDRGQAGTPHDAPDDDTLAQEQLDRLISVDFRSVTIREATAQIAAKARTNIHANWKVLEAVGITPNLRINLRLRDVPAGQALKLALEQTDEQVGDEKLTFDIAAGVAVTSSASGSRLYTTYEVYDVREILAWPPDPLALQALDPAPGDPGERDRSEERLTREEMIEVIITTLQDQVGEQAEWAAYGGEVNSVGELNGNLIVKARPTDHARIIELLGTLRSQVIDAAARALAEQAIAPLLEEADALREKERHAEALKLIEKALIIRPDHPLAAAMKTVVQEVVGRSPKGK